VAYARIALMMIEWLGTALILVNFAHRMCGKRRGGARSDEAAARPDLPIRKALEG
jgi:hypothetical protein